MGNEHSVPGPFPKLCEQYRQQLSRQPAKQATSKQPPQPAKIDNQPQIIGDPNDFFVNPFSEQGEGQADIYLVLDPEPEQDEQQTTNISPGTQTKSMPAAGNIIGDPDLFFANPFGRHPSQLAMAIGQEQHQSIPSQINGKDLPSKL